MKERIQRIVRRLAPHLPRLAAVLALIGLALMVVSILWPRPLLVILAMSVGHAIGGAAFVCYLVAVLVDIARLAPQPAETKDSIKNAQD